MPNCPSCTAIIEEDFGLTQCGSCGASVFVEMDGSVRVGEDVPNESVFEPETEVLTEELIEEPEEEVVESVPVMNDLAEIADFANSEVSLASEGIYHYSLTIKGIDDREVRADLREALTDAKFKWDVNEIIASINEGQLVLTELNPVKAFVLISRIKSLPVQITWEQHDIVS